MSTNDANPATRSAVADVTVSGDGSSEPAPIARRKKGQGGLETRKSDGAVRGTFRNARRELIRMPWCNDRVDATEQLQAALEEMEATQGLSSGGGMSLRTWGKDFLDQRELEGGRNASSEKALWKKHIATADFADWKLETVQTKDVKRWMVAMNSKKSRGRGGNIRANEQRALRPLSWQTKKHALNLLRTSMAKAIEDERVTDDFVNPCIGLRFKKPPTVKEATNFFTRPEIESIQKVAAVDVLAMMEFAIASAMRQGEMRALRDEDVHLDAVPPVVTVRYGKPPKQPTKGGAPRTVPLLPMAVRALRAWYAYRDANITFNPKGLVFPAERGGYRSAGRFLGRNNGAQWKALFKKAGITRHLVWHDLRHTGATALLGGYFGRKWRLEEIQKLLGHQDISTTERYAHALQETLNEAARATWGDIGEAEAPASGTKATDTGAKARDTSATATDTEGNSGSTPKADG